MQVFVTVRMAGAVHIMHLFGVSWHDKQLGSQVMQFPVEVSTCGLLHDVQVIGESLQVAHDVLH